MDSTIQDSLLKEDDLLTIILTKPKLALDFIITNCPKKYLFWLITLGGIATAINGAQVNLAAHKTLSIAILVFAIILGAVFGWISSYLYAWLLSWTGEWLNGHGKMNQFIVVIAWAMIPLIFNLVLLIPKFIIFGDNTFSIAVSELNNLETFFYYLFEFIKTILSIWALIILIAGICLIQKFNLAKAILNSLLPVIVIIIPVLLILGVVYILK